MRRALASRRRTTRTSPWHPAWCLPGCGLHIAAVYAFARTADDFADEDGYTLAERHALLDDWHRRLLRAAGRETVGTEVPAPHPAAEPSRWFPEAQRPVDVQQRLCVEPGLQSRRTAVDPDLIFLALSHTMRSCELEVDLFEDLLSAFRQDTVVHRYAAWDDVLDYCRRSANPVGRLVLRIAGYRDRESRHFVGRALHRPPAHEFLAGSGRRLAPRPAVHPACRTRCRRCQGCRPRLRSHHSRHGSRRSCRRRPGRATCSHVAVPSATVSTGGSGTNCASRGWAQSRILDRLEASGFDVFNRRPSLGAVDAPRLAGGLITWGRRIA